MGYNTVAVIYNDQIGHKLRSLERMDESVRAWSSRQYTGDSPLCFGFGRVISQAHADYEQVVIVSRNMGQRASEATDLGPYALLQMQECLERHGYRVTKRRQSSSAKRFTLADMGKAR